MDLFFFLRLLGMPGDECQKQARSLGMRRVKMGLKVGGELSPLSPWSEKGQKGSDMCLGQVLMSPCKMECIDRSPWECGECRVNRASRRRRA